MKQSAMFVIFCFAVCLLVSTAIADSSVTTGPAITLSGTGTSVPTEVIDQLIRDFPDAASIHITGWSAPPRNDVSAVPASLFYHYENITLNVAESNGTIKDMNVISCAKGATTQLVTEFDQTVSSSVSLAGNFSGENIPVAGSAELGISNSVRVSISVTRTFSGPPESSEYNSREFRVRWYGRIGGWHGTYVPLIGSSREVWGSWKEVIGYVKYSIDRYIKPLN